MCDCVTSMIKDSYLVLGQVQHLWLMLSNRSLNILQSLCEESFEGLMQSDIKLSL